MKHLGEEDTGFNVGSYDVSIDIEVDPDEFSLKDKINFDKHQNLPLQISNITIICLFIFNRLSK